MVYQDPLRLGLLYHYFCGMQANLFSLFPGAILMAAFFCACENDPAEIEAMNAKVEDIEEGRNISGVFSQAGELKATLKAPLMYRVKGDTVYAEFPQSVLVYFYKDTATIESVVTAHYAKYFEQFAKVYLRDSVVVYNMLGDTLFAKDLWWDQGAQIFYTYDSVRISTPTQRLRGTAFRSKADFTGQTIENAVGDVELPPGFEG